jgi:hypothetical protein
MWFRGLSGQLWHRCCLIESPIVGAVVFVSQVVARYNASQLVTLRDQISTEVRANLGQRLAESFHITVSTSTSTSTGTRTSTSTSALSLVAVICCAQPLLVACCLLGWLPSS